MFILTYTHTHIHTHKQEMWPGVTSLQDWNPSFPVWPAIKLTKFCATIDEAGLELLEVCVCVCVCVCVYVFFGGSWWGC